MKIEDEIDMILRLTVNFRDSAGNLKSLGLKETQFKIVIRECNVHEVS